MLKTLILNRPPISEKQIKNVRQIKPDCIITVIKSDDICGGGGIKTVDFT